MCKYQVQWHCLLTGDATLDAASDKFASAPFRGVVFVDHTGEWTSFVKKPFLLLNSHPTEKCIVMLPQSLLTGRDTGLLGRVQADADWTVRWMKGLPEQNMLHLRSEWTSPSL